MVTMKQALKDLLGRLQNDPILVVGLGDRIPNIHSFCPKQYRDSIKHLGFGFFEGSTEHGTFSFDAGGAMGEIRIDEASSWSLGGHSLAWTYLRVDHPDVIKDLGYDTETVKAELQKLLEAT